MKLFDNFSVIYFESFFEANHEAVIFDYGKMVSYERNENRLNPVSIYNKEQHVCSFYSSFL